MSAPPSFASYNFDADPRWTEFQKKFDVGSADPEAATNKLKLRFYREYIVGSVYPYCFVTILAERRRSTASTTSAIPTSKTCYVTSTCYMGYVPHFRYGVWPWWHFWKQSVYKAFSCICWRYLCYGIVPIISQTSGIFNCIFVWNSASPGTRWKLSLPLLCAYFCNFIRRSP